jgi:hypothetical protein
VPPFTLSLSIGVTDWAVAGTLADVVGRADQAMYDAKKGGKHVAVCRGHQQPHLQNALAILPGLVFPGGNPNQLARTIVSEDFESPYYDQLTFEVQRELARDVVWRVGYVGTREATCFRRSTATRACHIRRLALIPAGE